jgi:hypothetical protein
MPGIPASSGGRDWDDHSLRLAVEKVCRSPSQPIGGCGGTLLSSQLCGKINRKIIVQASLGKKETLFGK